MVNLPDTWRDANHPIYTPNKTNGLGYRSFKLLLPWPEFISATAKMQLWYTQIFNTDTCGSPGAQSAIPNSHIPY